MQSFLLGFRAGFLLGFRIGFCDGFLLGSASVGSFCLCRAIYCFAQLDSPLALSHYVALLLLELDGTAFTLAVGFPILHFTTTFSGALPPPLAAAGAASIQPLA